MSKSYEIYPPPVSTGTRKSEHFCEFPNRYDIDLNSVFHCLDCDRWYKLIFPIFGAHREWKVLRGFKLRKVLKEIHSGKA